MKKRNRTLIAFSLLCGARDKAIASLRLKHIDLEKRTVSQDAREVRTKFRKTFTSRFFPVSDDIERIVLDWIAYLKSEKLFGPDDPLFPATTIARGENGLFGPVGFGRVHWKNAGAIRKIFKQGFVSAGLPYYNPHSFRDTLIILGEQPCRTPEGFKVWSQTLGHKKVLTTFRSYGTVSSQRQAEITQ